MYIACEKYLFNLNNGIFNRLYNLTFISLPKKKNWNIFYIDMVFKKFVGIWWAKDHMSFFIFVKIEIQKGCL